ncbi:hypothetical protein GCM10010492_50880 [Saccharothrix mutabilis subsp. mutabilis]|uniref:Uncharacterized protein n=1 Tax=Saccharothrix mutabilis subsp. mutabilis TaxID=66855 RepID=A0ABP3DWN4_9PSEU
MPGHGPLIETPQWTEVLAAHARYYEFVATTAESAPARGLTPLEAAREADPGAFAALPDSERLVLNLRRAV